MKAAFLLIATLLATGSASAQKIAWAPKSDKGFDQAMEQGRFVLQFFVRPKCADCALLERTVFKDPDITSYLGERFVAIRSDASTPNGRIDAENYGIETFPSILFFNSRGELIEHATVSGMLGSSEFLQHILNVTSGKFSEGAVASTGQVQATAQAVAAPPPAATAWSKPDTTKTIAPPPLPDTTAPAAP